tara:strand:+ start:736 stop:1302 length:567 start_codon:yes stop_codon:yes gene_type:complete
MVPTFTIYTGPMYGSKTSRLIADIDRFSRQKKKVLAFKPRIDDRYSESKICSHSGATVNAYCVSKGSDVLDVVEKELLSDDRPLEYVVAIDEAFMIDGIADTLLSVFKKGITVIVSSIQLSANFKPFEEMQAMMPYATKIDICPAVCPETGEDAYYTFSKLKVGHDPVVGGEGMYEPRSFHAHPALTS